VDRITQNDEGAFATRQLLQRDPDRLTGKRVVVYEFAARELALGD
jgi:alginate O-acetyltransferase complex protein AlgJ